MDVGPRRYSNVNRNRQQAFCQQDQTDWKEQPDRTILTNVPDFQVMDNTISTTNSNFFTFIPLNLISQMSKPANVYFIIIAVLQTMPSISNTSGKPLVLIPLICVTLAVLLKDAYEEFYRYLKDREQNNRKTQVLTPEGYSIVQVQKLRIGDVVRISKDETVPCDIVILQTSDEKGRSYVQTKSLDGQANLKTKKVPNCQKLKYLTAQQLYRQNFKLQYEKPNPYMHNFTGVIEIYKQKLPLYEGNLILKGSSLRNVLWTAGVCVYTGQQTKLSLNSVKFKAKRSKLEKQVNRLVILIFIMQFLLSLVCSVMNMLLEMSNFRELDGISTHNFWIMTGSWWLMLTYFIPISLVVTLQLVKMFQGNLMARDQRMYSAETDSMPVMNNSSVNQNLGQIKYIFSDKTGTLTANIMNFKKICIRGRVYGQTHQSANCGVPHVSFHDEQFLKVCDTYLDVFEILALCHEVVIENSPQHYNSSSPDELALVNFAKFCNFQFLGEQNEQLLIFHRKINTVLRYTLLATLQFSSDRKRMSVIVRDSRNKIHILTKGADNLVKKLLKDGMYLNETQSQIDRFSEEGLRTLMLARREIPHDEYEAWRELYDEATCSLQDRAARLTQVYSKIQHSLQLVGATAVQDKLQEGVRDTIQKIRECNITFYILTGDKRETAVNIGRSCGMIQPDTEILLPPDVQDVEQVIRWLKQRSPLPSNSVLLLNASLPLPTIPLHPTICYRCTPTQKQIVVRSVKSQTDELTLAVGDGSNDVNMIITASVGIGIRGKEGNQINRVSDFVLGQFSLLSPLILYFGRQWYRRNSKLVNYSFFKNIYHVMAIIGYGGLSFFSGNILFQSFFYQFYNVLFASLPIMLWALVDEEYTYKQSLRLPSVYERGQEGDFFNQWTYWKNIILGTIYGVGSALIVLGVMEGGVLDQFGRVSHQSQSSIVLYFNMILIVNFKVLLMSHGQTVIVLLSVMFTFLNFWLFYQLYNYNYPNNDVYETLYLQTLTPSIWMLHLLLCSVGLITDFVVKKLSDWEKEKEYREELKRRKKKQVI